MSGTKAKILLRVSIVSIYATLNLLFLQFVIGFSGLTNRPNSIILIFMYIFDFNLASETNLLFDKYLNKRLPWFYNTGKRLTIQIIFTFVCTTVITSIPFIVWYFISGKSPIFRPFPLSTFVSGLVFLVSFSSIYIAMNFFKNWKSTILEMERLKQEKLKSDYMVLQDQLNPHFLFNSLNVLISEIKHEPETAINFTRKLSQVYRYVLQSRNMETVLLKDEMDFIDSYIYLHRVRLGNALKFSAELDESVLNKYLPPMTVQILVENAIKHNVVNRDFPLNIKIETIGDEILKVRNNINPKETIGSTQVGLSNIQERYSLLGRGNIFVEKTEEEFIVTVPLLTD